MTMYLILGLSGLIIFGWGVFCPVRYPHSSVGPPRWVIVSSWIISALFYGYAVLNLLVDPWKNMQFISQFFLFCGVFFLFVFSGWIGCKIADAENARDYFRQVRNLDGQIKDIKTNKAS